jgi:hypothetical protein
VRDDQAMHRLMESPTSISLPLLLTASFKETMNAASSQSGNGAPALAPLFPDQT